jgi:hypothetical protein
LQELVLIYFPGAGWEVQGHATQHPQEKAKESTGLAQQPAGCGNIRAFCVWQQHTCSISTEPGTARPKQKARQPLGRFSGIGELPDARWEVQGHALARNPLLIAKDSIF